MADYFVRYAEKEIERRLKSCGAVVVEGPKFCGKTTTSLRFAKSSIRLTTKEAINVAKLETRNVLNGEKLRVIDEWQTVPNIWNHVRAWIDENPGFGQFILTGSSTPANKDELYHSGAGRIVKVAMKPMSLSESRESKKIVSLKELFEKESVNVFEENTDFGLKQVSEILCRGGWPLSVVSDKDVALDVTKNYYSGIFNFENTENDSFRNKKPEVLRMVLKSYARNISTEAPIQTIRADVITSNNRTMDTKTIDDYLDALRDLFIIEDMEAWNPNLRSKTAVRTTATRHFTDTSIATCALGISPEDLMKDLNTFGLFFEDMAVRDLKIYSQMIGGTLKHYRDSNGLECDAVIHLENGQWAAVEIKLGGDDLIEEGAKNLLQLKSIVADNNIAFMMIVTATGSSYRRKDGIYVVPINCLTA